MVARASPARSSPRAQEYEHGTALLCDTQRQVERYVALFNGEERSAINAVNSEEQNPTACALETVAFVRGWELGTARSKESAFLRRACVPYGQASTFPHSKLLSTTSNIVGPCAPSGSIGWRASHSRRAG
jgi:hypothetical protein